jgi:SAM-dependent methyltransferase
MIDLRHPDLSTRLGLRLTGLADVLDQYLREVPIAHALFRAAELLPLAGLELERPVLEVGCGIGQVARFALDQPTDVGVDLSARRICRARKQGGYLRLECCDARALPFVAGEFGSALCISVLEHTREPAEIVAEMFRTLKPGGKAVVSVVLADLHRHLWYPRLCGRIGLGALGRAYQRAQDWAFRHVTLLSQDDWEAMFRAAGFELLSSTRAVGPAAVAWWDALLPLALPYRFAEAMGVRSVWRPRWLRRLIARWVLRLVEKEDGSGACLVVVAEKPGRCDGSRATSGDLGPAQAICASEVAV